MDQSKEDRSDFLKLILILKSNIFVILGFVFVAGILSIILSLQMPNKYRSEIKIVPSTEEGNQGLGALAGQFGGLASMAGINLGGKSDVNIILDTVKSRSFIKPLIDKYDLTYLLFAIESWDMATNNLIIDEKVYDSANKKWVRDVELPKQPKPSLEEAYEEFNKYFSVHLNKKTNLITLSVTYYSPEIAKQWIDYISIELSEYLRKIEQTKADESIEYLTAERSNSNIVDIRKVLSEILKEQYQKKMLTEIRKYYGFDIRDHSYIPEKKHSPKRAFIVIGSVFFGFILSIVFIFLRLFWKEIKHG